MGPRLFSRGNGVTALISSNSSGSLQWGHDFSAVEIQHNRHVHLLEMNSFNGATTFQPWKWICREYPFYGQPASMGPRLFSRGNFKFLGG